MKHRIYQKIYLKEYQEVISMNGDGYYQYYKKIVEELSTLAIML